MKRLKYGGLLCSIFILLSLVLSVSFARNAHAEWNISTIAMPTGDVPLIKMILGSLGLIGVVFVTVGWIWVLVLAFLEEGVSEAFCFYLIQPLFLIFVVKRWKISKKPFFIWLGGVMMILPLFLVDVYNK